MTPTAELIPAVADLPDDFLSTAAERAAETCWNANLHALQQTQPRLGEAMHDLSADVEWVFARDGVLTGLLIGDRWHGDCSLPLRAAQFMFDKADLSAPAVCFLNPSHAAQLRVCLDAMESNQAIVALTPDLAELCCILHCENFSRDIGRHRLYFAWGAGWEAELDRLCDEHPGLPAPTQFIRPVLPDTAPLDALIPPARKVFAEQALRRAEKTRTARQQWRASGQISRICLVAPSRFRLWDDTGAALLEAMSMAPAGIEVQRFDSDDPTSASPLALALAAARCDAIVMPNMARADLPDLIPDAMPCLTWLTGPRIPSAVGAGEKDALLVADAAWKTLAVKAGWVEARVRVAQWPALFANDSNPSAAPAGPVGSALADATSKHRGTLANIMGSQTRPTPAGVRPQGDRPGVFEVPPPPALAIISDTRPLDTPAAIAEYSSHRLLWEGIAEELLADPFALQDSPDRFLQTRMRRAKIADENFNRAAFLDVLIANAYQQGLARLLMQLELNVRLFGSGWHRIDAFKAHAAGPVRSRDDLARAVASATALLHVWPSEFAHPIEAMGKPVLRVARRRDAFTRNARAALAGKLSKPATTSDPLTAASILEAFSRLKSSEIHEPIPHV